MDVLVVVGTTVTYLFSIYMALFTETNVYGNKEVYFESSMFVITLILFGKYLESKTKNNTRKSMEALINLKPKYASILRDDKEIKIYIDSLKKRNLVVVHKGEIIPCDEIIIKGNTTINESNFTGESVKVHKSINDEVIGSTINISNEFVLKATRVGKESKFSEIIKLVREAQSSVAPIQKLVDKVSGFFVPTVIGISLITFIIWYFVIFKGAEYFLPKSFTTIQSDGKDELKKDASLVIKYLKKKKIKVIMITGEKRSMHLILLVKLELVM